MNKRVAWNERMKKSPHLLTVDFESWIFSEKINKKKLSIKKLKDLDDKYSLEALEYILKVLKKNKQKITFFLVFKLEEIYPGIIKKILADGHEVGWHTHTHAVIKDIKTLKKELELSKHLIKKYKIKGFQAPTISFIKEGYPLLKKYGFSYSSSIYGDSNKLYNFNGLYEIPVSVFNKRHKPQLEEIEFPSDMNIWKLLKFGIPYGSSFFWGVLGKQFYKNILNKEAKENNLCNMFIHDWQLITPTSNYYKKDVSVLSNPLFFTFFLLYRKNVSGLFEYLLSKFSFKKMIDYVEYKKKI